MNNNNNNNNNKSKFSLIESDHCFTKTKKTYYFIYLFVIIIKYLKLACLDGLCKLSCVVKFHKLILAELTRRLVGPSAAKYSVSVTFNDCVGLEANPGRIASQPQQQ